MSKQRVVDDSTSEDDQPLAARPRNLFALTAAVKKEVKKGKAQAKADKSSASATVKKEKSETPKPDAKAKSKAEDEKPLQIKGKPKGKDKDGKAKGGEIVVKRERKVFDLPGQRYETPLERDPLRIFYETLREQRPSSEMAEVWLMERGLLPKEEAAKAFAKKQKRAEASRTPSGRKATPVKRIKPASDDEDDKPLAKKRKPPPSTKKTTKVETAKKKPAGKNKTKTSAKKKRKSSSDEESDADDSESEDEKPLARRQAKKAK